MARYEYKDARSEKFWEIELQEDEYTVRFGRLGTAGQTSTKAFADAATAKKAADKLIASKLRKGYVLVDEEISIDDTAAADRNAADRNAELEAAIHADPDNQKAWKAYGSWLLGIGDVRGKLLALEAQLAEASGDKAKRLRSEMDGIVENHRELWLGSALAKMYRKAEAQDDFSHFLRAKWFGGFLVSARVNAVYEWQGPTVVEFLRQLVSSPAARFLRHIGIGLLDIEDYEGHLSQGVLAICKSGKLPALRHLRIGDFEYPDNTEISWSNVGDVSKVYPVAPNLEFLHVQGGGIELGQLAHSKLKRLKLETGGLPAEALKSVLTSDLPCLEDLEIWLGTEDYGGSCNVAMLAPLLAGDLFPHLESLGLKNADFQNDIAKAMATAPILKRISRLDMSMGTMTNEGAQAIVDAADSFRHLEKLNLSDNFIGDELASKLSLKFPQRVDLNDQDEPDDYGGEIYTYVSVGE